MIRSGKSEGDAPGASPIGGWPRDNVLVGYRGVTIRTSALFVRRHPSRLVYQSSRGLMRATAWRQVIYLLLHQRILLIFFGDTEPLCQQHPAR